MPHGKILRYCYVTLFCLDPCTHICTIFLCCTDETGIILPHKHSGLSSVSHRKWNSLIDRLKYGRCLVFINENIVSYPVHLKSETELQSVVTILTLRPSLVSTITTYFFFKPKDTFFSLEKRKRKHNVQFVSVMCVSMCNIASVPAQDLIFFRLFFCSLCKTSFLVFLFSLDFPLNLFQSLCVSPLFVFELLPL